MKSSFFKKKFVLYLPKIMLLAILGNFFFVCEEKPQFV